MSIRALINAIPKNQMDAFWDAFQAIGNDSSAYYADSNKDALESAAGAVSSILNALGDINAIGSVAAVAMDLNEVLVVYQAIKIWNNLKNDESVAIADVAGLINGITTGYGQLGAYVEANSSAVALPAAEFMSVIGVFTAAYCVATALLKAHNNWLGDSINNGVYPFQQFMDKTINSQVYRAAGAVNLLHILDPLFDPKNSAIGGEIYNLSDANMVVFCSGIYDTLCGKGNAYSSMLKSGDTSSFYQAFNLFQISSVNSPLFGKLQVSSIFQVTASQVRDNFYDFLAVFTQSCLVFAPRDQISAERLKSQNLAAYALWQHDRNIYDAHADLNTLNFSQGWIASRLAYVQGMAATDFEPNANNVIPGANELDWYSDFSTGNKLGTGPGPSASAGVVQHQIVFGSNANDTIDGLETADSLFGSSGNDVLNGAGGNDYIEGNDGNDVIHGGDNNDTIYGGTGTDRLYGDSGNDYIVAGDDGSFMDGGDGDDVLVGGAGDDTLHGGTGTNVLTGGKGYDTYTYSGSDKFNDTIIDSDGKGRIWIDTTALSGTDQRTGVNTWQAGSMLYVKQPGANGQSDLLIKIGDGQTILVKNFSNGDLGISLSGEVKQTKPDTADSQFNVNYDENTDSYSEVANGLGMVAVMTAPHEPHLANVLTGSDGASTVIGSAYEDLITLGNGNNFVIGGGGHDAVLAGDGNNTITASSVGADPTSHAGDALIAVGDGNNSIALGDGGGLIHTGKGDNQISLGSGFNIVMTGVPEVIYKAGVDWKSVVNQTLGFQDVWTGGTLTGTSIAGTQDVGPEPANYEGMTIAGTTVPYVGGNSTITGSSGHDIIYLSNGNNLVQLGTGPSLVIGGMGKDTIIGGGGAADIYGGGGDSLIFAGSGAVRIFGEGGSNTIYGGAGQDTIYSGDGDDWTTKGIAGINYVQAGTGNTLILGSSKEDDLIGGAGNDTIYAGSGEEYLEGGAGSNLLFAGSGSDTLVSSAGATDTLVGGDGHVIMQGSGASTNYQVGNGDATIYAGMGDAAGMKSYVLGAKGATTVYVNSGYVEAQGGAGDLTVDFSHGQATGRVFAGTGTTAVYGGTDVIEVHGGSGKSVFYAGNGGTADLANNLIAGSGDTTMYGGAGASLLDAQAGSGHDLLVGGSGTTVMLGGYGDDTFRAGTGTTAVHLGYGNNLIETNTSYDWIRIDQGGNGTLRFTGGETAETMSAIVAQDSTGSLFWELSTSAGTIDIAQGTAAGLTVEFGDGKAMSFASFLQHTSEESDSDGTRTSRQFSDSGVLLSDSWSKSDGTYGNDTYNADGTIADGYQFGADGSHIHATNDGHGNASTKNFGSDGSLINETWASADGSHGYDAFGSNGNTEKAVAGVDGSKSVVEDDGKGNVYTAIFDADMEKTNESWRLVDGSSGSITYNRDNSSTGFTINSDGSSFDFEKTADGAETIRRYDAQHHAYESDNISPQGTETRTNLQTGEVMVIDGDGVYSTSVTGEDGRVITQIYSAAGKLISDSWTGTDGSTGNDSFLADGSSVRTTKLADGSSSVLTDDGKQDIFVRFYDKNGRQAADRWQKADGTSGSDSYDEDGSSVTEVHFADGGYQITQTSSSGKIRATFYNAEGHPVRVVETDSGEGSPTISGENTAFNSAHFVKDGSYTVTGINASGEATISFYDGNNQLVGSTSYAIPSFDAMAQAFDNAAGDSGYGDMAIDYHVNLNSYMHDGTEASYSLRSVQNLYERGFDLVVTESLAGANGQTLTWENPGSLGQPNVSYPEIPDTPDESREWDGTTPESYYTLGGALLWQHDSTPPAEPITTTIVQADTTSVAIQHLFDTLAGEVVSLGGDNSNVVMPFIVEENPDGTRSFYKVITKTTPAGSSDGGGRFIPPSDYVHKYANSEGTSSYTYVGGHLTSIRMDYLNGTSYTETVREVPGQAGVTYPWIVTGLTGTAPGGRSMALQADGTIAYYSNGQLVGIGADNNGTLETAIGQSIETTAGSRHLSDPAIQIPGVDPGSYGESLSIRDSDGSSTKFDYGYNTLTTTKTNADGSTVVGKFDLFNNTGTTTTTWLDGTYSVAINDGTGGYLINNYNSDGTLASDRWKHADGTTGSDDFTKQLPRVTNPDGSYYTTDDDGHGTVTVRNYDAAGHAQNYTVAATDAAGTKTTTTYSAAGVALSDLWSRADGTHGDDTFNVDGTRSGHSVQPNGVSRSYTRDAIGVVSATITASAAGQTITGVAGEHDTLIGAFANDTLVGGGTDDTFVYDANHQVIVESNPDANATLRTSENLTTVPINIDHVVLSSTLMRSVVGDDRAMSFAVQSSNNATIKAGNGNDTVTGADYDYVIGLGSGNNIIALGKGSSSITATSGNNQISFGDGHDLVTLGGGNNTVNGGNGDDVLSLGDGGNWVTLGYGADSLAAGNGNNHIVLGNGQDTVSVGTGVNYIEYGYGDSRITLKDILGGSNTVRGGDGDSSIIAGQGNDVFHMGLGNNTINGGDGSVLFDLGNGDNVIKFGNGNNTLTAGYGSNKITFGDGEDLITTGDGNSTINAGNGNDTIFAGGSSNHITVGKGNDYIHVGLGANTIVATGGNDTVIAGDGPIRLTLGDGNNSVTLGEGNEVVSLGHGSNTLTAGWGNNTYTVGNGDNHLSLGDGTDTLTIGTGHNDITLGYGKNTLTLGAGYDTIRAGTGKETITNNGGQVTVMLGNVAEDHLWFSQSGQNLVVKVLGSTEQITVNNWYAADSNHIGTFVAGDGKALTDAGVQQLVQAMSSFAVPSASQTQYTAAEQQKLAPVLAANWH